MVFIESTRDMLQSSGKLLKNSNLQLKKIYLEKYFFPIWPVSQLPDRALFYRESLFSGVSFLVKGQFAARPSGAVHGE